MKQYAISDIHGCLKSFQALLKQITLTSADELYLLGDFTDRGPDSKGVIDFIRQLKVEGYTVHCLRGNHDQMLLDAAKSSIKENYWLPHGGQETLQSYGVSQASDIPVDHLYFLQTLPYYFQIDNYILVHAGLDFNTPDPMTNMQGMMWSRNWYDNLNHQWLGDRIIIHGHTPTPQQGIRKRLEKLKELPAMSIDNGCVYTGRQGMGGLCALELRDHKLFFQPNIVS